MIERNEREGRCLRRHSDAVERYRDQPAPGQTGIAAVVIVVGERETS